MAYNSAFYAIRSKDNKANLKRWVGPIRERLFSQAVLEIDYRSGTRLHNYNEVREYLEKQHPDRLRALTPRHINAPPEYWAKRLMQTVLASKFLSSGRADRVLARVLESSLQPRGSKTRYIEGNPVQPIKLFEIVKEIVLSNLTV